MLVPEIWTDWDNEIHKRSYNQVEKRRYYTSEWGRVRREFKYLTIIYSLENILLSLPLLYTCGRLMYRHTILTPLHIEVPVITSAYFLMFFIPGSNTPKYSNILEFYPRSIFHRCWTTSVQVVRFVQQERSPVVQVTCK